ncbi:cardiolipin synthase (cmp-forming) [Anaeramoeba ignava]|uniref:Cardiolipin synthase (Cmp-forming) n=1 Tax=Anaeramoeba ignava TaxID=1746090 RepID=A0A9Q0R547_ANAIG|nr:cardiolipin synthase (cmp-forming) [Anaeramoeba ignava]
MLRNLTNNSIKSQNSLIIQKILQKNFHIKNLNFLSKIFSKSKSKNENENENKFKNENDEQIKKNEILTIPNALSTIRLFTGPLSAYELYNNKPKTSLLLFTFSSITDFLDGYLARKYNQESTLGTVLDPFADKVMTSSMSIVMGIKRLLPVPLVAFFLFKDISLVAFYLSLKSKISPDETISVHPSKFGKYNVASQILLMMSILISKSFISHPKKISKVIEFLIVTTTATSFMSGFDYLRQFLINPKNSGFKVTKN